MSKISNIVAAVAVLPIVAIAGSTAFAGSPGQLAGGSTYQVKDLTQSGAYASTITAACNDEIEYSMMLSNTQFGALNNVTLTATLPSAGGQSTATAVTDLGGTSGTSDSVNVTLPSNATQTLEDGTTVLYNGSGSAISTLPDTITSSGVNVGTIDGSTTEFVNFKAKVSCTTTPPVTPPTTPPATVTTTSKPTQLVNTGPGDTIGIFAAVAVLATAGYHFVLSRRLSRQ